MDAAADTAGGRGRRAWVTPALVVGALVLAALVAGALWVVTGLETEVSVEDRRALITAGKIVDVVGGGPVVSEREVYDKTQLRDLICELKYSYDDTAASGVMVDHLIIRELDVNEAESTRFWLEHGVDALEGEFEEEVVETELAWGDAGRVTLIKRQGAGIAWRFLGRKDNWVQQIVIAGTSLTNEAFVGIVDEALTRFERQRPCGG